MEGQSVPTNVPTSVKVFGILHTIFGTIGLIVGLANLGRGEAAYEILRQLGFSALMLNWIQITTYLSPLISLVLLVLGIGLLMKKPWGRSGSIIYGYFAIGYSILNMLLMFISMSGSANAGNATAIAALIGSSIGGAISLIYPILTIVFLGKPAVKAALERRNHPV